MNFFTRGALAAILGMAAILGTAIAATAAEVNVYSSRHYDTDKSLYQTFTQQTGIRVNVIEGGDDELIERIRTEAGNSPADILITVDAGRLWRAQNAGILQPVKSKILEDTVPEYLREPTGLWFGLTKRARVIIYNKSAVKPSELSTYEDLADPKWKGRLLIRSSTNVYNQSLAGSILAAHGEKATEEWARGIVANLARRPQGETATRSWR
jgi:iron(III) transport system substrate-binding protein